MKPTLARIVLGCGGAVLMSACSVQHLEKAQDSLLSNNEEPVVMGAVAVGRIPQKAAFITERKVSGVSNKETGELTINAMIATLQNDLKSKSVALQDKFHENLLTVEKEVAKEKFDVSLAEFEDSKRTINIELLKADVEIDRVKGADECSPHLIAHDPSINVVQRADGRASSAGDVGIVDGDPEVCDDISDRLTSLDEDVNRLKLELLTIIAKEKLFQQEQEMSINRKAIHQRLACSLKYDNDLSELNNAYKNKVMMIKLIHNLDKDATPTLESLHDLLATYKDKMTESDDKASGEDF